MPAPAPPAHAFHRDFTVPEAAIDALGHANNIEYLRWVQDVAGAHWRSICPDEEQKIFIWVVREHRIRYHRPAFAGEELQASTWVGDTHGATSVRHTRLTRGGELLCEAETTWVLLDPATTRPVRVTPQMLGWLRP